jgi:hypothetical protein
MKNNKLFYLVLMSLIALVNICSAQLELEVEYPAIFGFSPGESIPSFAIYAFVFLISIGAVLVMVVLVTAGIEFILAGGEPGKINEAKNRIKSAFLGMIVLLSSWVILYTINNVLVNPVIVTPECEFGIMVNIRKEKEVKMWPTMETKTKVKEFEKCIAADENIDGEIIETEKAKFPGNQVKEVWAFTEYDFKGTPTMLYQDLSNTEVTGEPNIASVPLGTKSIKIIKKIPGYYLYDKNNFGILNKFPLYLSGSASNLSNNNFENATQSINIIIPKSDDPASPDVLYAAVLFPDPEYRGNCSILEASKLSDMSSISVGPQQLSSLIAYELHVKENNIGSVVFYNAINCGESSSEEVKECEIKIFPGANTEKIISSEFSRQCPGFKGDIMSFRINGELGVVLREKTKGLCQYWDITSVLGGGNCVANIIGSDVYNPALGGKRPYSFMAFQVK